MKKNIPKFRYNDARNTEELAWIQFSSSPRYFENSAESAYLGLYGPWGHLWGAVGWPKIKIRPNRRHNHSRHF